MTFPTNRDLVPPEKPPGSHAARNEQIKLIAAYLNGIAIALITVGILAPTFAYLYGASASGVTMQGLVPGYVICAVSSPALHLIAVAILRGIKP